MSDEPLPWRYRSSGLVVLFLCVGPLMLPLVWAHPTMSRRAKAGWTALMALVTLALAAGMKKAVDALSAYYGLIFSLSL